MKRHGVFLQAILLVLGLIAPAWAAEVRREIHFPDLPEYQTLVCDLHMHTVFSDGSVWPQVRVEEAWRQGLDAIAITDHIEYQPHKDDVPTKHGRSNELAAGAARQANLLFPVGAEITRDTPPGHFNAIFLKDVAALDTPDFVEAVKRANEQGAFVFWNHQAWKGEEAGKWLDVHTTLYDNGWMHGMEVCNGDSYYPTAHQWCLDRNLTMMGNTDIHAPDLLVRSEPGKHRTLTLVFAKDRTLEALHESLKERRTAVWFNDQIIGRQEWLAPLLNGCVSIAKPHMRSKDAVWVEMRNTSDVDVKLKRTGKTGPAELMLPAQSTSVVKIGTSTPGEPIELAYEATNFLIAPNTGLLVTWQVAGP